MKKLLAYLALLPTLATAAIYTPGSGAGGSVSLTALNTVNTLYVREGGDDSSAAKGDPSKPWGSIPAAVTNAAAGDTILVFPGDYPVTVTSNGFAPIFFTNQNNITMKGVGRPTIYATNDSYSAIVYIQRGNNIEISGFKFVALTNRPGGEDLLCGIELRGSNNWNIVLKDNDFWNIPGHGITHLDSLRGSDTNIVIRGNRFYNIGSKNASTGYATWDGACISGIGSFADVSDNYGIYVVKGVEIESVAGTWPVEHVKIQGNRFIDILKRGIQIITPGGANVVSDVVISDNILECFDGDVENASNQGIQVLNAENIIITDNQIKRFKSHFIHIAPSTGKGVRNLLIADNIVEQAATNVVNGIYLQQSAGDITNAVVSGNIVREMANSGIVVGGINVSVLDNMIIDPSTNGAGYGIQIVNFGSAGDSSNIVARGNMIGSIGNGSPAGGILIENDVLKAQVYDNYNLGTWPAIADSGVATIRQGLIIQTNSVDVGANERVNLIAGANVTITGSKLGGTNAVTITSAGGSSDPLVLATGMTNIGYRATFFHVPEIDGDGNAHIDGSKESYIVTNSTTLTLTLTNMVPGHLVAVEVINNATGVVQVAGDPNPTWQDGTTTAPIAPTNGARLTYYFTVTPNATNAALSGPDNLKPTLTTTFLSEFQTPITISAADSNIYALNFSFGSAQTIDATNDVVFTNRVIGLAAGAVGNITYRLTNAAAVNLIFPAAWELNNQPAVTNIGSGKYAEVNLRAADSGNHISAVYVVEQ